MKSTNCSVSRRTFVGQLSAGAAALVFPSVLRSQESAPKKLGVALVGLGGYSTGQLGPALKETKHCRLAGVVTGDREKARRWAREYGFSEKNVYDYDTMHRMADNPEIDIVYVVTPNALHAQHTIAAAKAGKHVICEKPMAISVQECDAMIEACQSAGRKLSIGYRLHFDPYHQEMMRLAKDPGFGPFKKLHGRFGFVMQSRVWRAQKALAGGGPIMDLGVYVIQNACMAVGGPTRSGGPIVWPVAVTAKEGRKTHPEIFTDVDQEMSWTLEFEGGVKGEGVTSYGNNFNDFRNEAAHGWFSMDPAYTYGPLRGRTHRGELSFKQVNQQALQMDDFALCVRENRESRVPGPMGRRDVAVIEAVYESANNRSKRVELAKWRDAAHAKA